MRYDAARKIIADLVLVESVLGEDVDQARQLLETAPGVSARDAIHTAVGLRLDAREMMTFDVTLKALWQSAVKPGKEFK